MEKIICGILLIATLLMSCQKERTYEAWVQAELAKPERQDSLFMDIYFGMSSKDFFAHCWKLNRAGKLFDGTGNTRARFRLESELPYPANFEFYPKFTDGVITAMPCVVAYEGWAPWNKDLAAGKLIDPMRELLEDWYDIEFEAVASPAAFGKAYLNISSNRKILLYYKNDDRLEVVFVDLTKEEDVPNKLL